MGLNSSKSFRWDYFNIRIPVLGRRRNTGSWRRREEGGGSGESEAWTCALRKGEGHRKEDPKEETKNGGRSTGHGLEVVWSGPCLGEA